MELRPIITLIAMASPGFEWGLFSQEEDSDLPLVQLAPHETFGQRIALKESLSTFSMPVSALKFEPLVDVQSRNSVESQGDVTIRGGIFENTGFMLGGGYPFRPADRALFCRDPRGAQYDCFPQAFSPVRKTPLPGSIPESVRCNTVGNRFARRRNWLWVWVGMVCFSGGPTAPIRSKPEIGITGLTWRLPTLNRMAPLPMEIISSTVSAEGSSFPMTGPRPIFSTVINQNFLDGPICTPLLVCRKPRILRQICFSSIIPLEAKTSGYNSAVITGGIRDDYEFDRRNPGRVQSLRA